MKALVLKENGKLKYGDIPFPERPAEEADIAPRRWTLLKVLAAGICGSDIERAFAGKAYHYPLVMGHEFTAEVAEETDGGKYKTGDRVAVFPLIPCKSCTPCTVGAYAQCEDYDYLGSRRDGAFAQYVWAPEENLFPLPEWLDPVTATMTEPAAVALHGARKLNAGPGMSAAVIGGGTVGNLAAQWLRMWGCRPVFVADIDPGKLKIARKAGFIPVNSAESDPVKMVMEATEGRGVDCAVEACGLPDTFLQTLRMTARFGNVLFMGNIRGEFKVGEKDFSSILRRELIIHGTWNSAIVPNPSDDWSTTIQAMRYELALSPFISHHPPLSEGVKIFNEMRKGEGHYNKVIFKIDEERG
jgi:L-iditol 2-dehydrogenase